jgi:hypothetical protein
VSFRQHSAIFRLCKLRFRLFEFRAYSVFSFNLRASAFHGASTELTGYFINTNI